LAHQKDEGEDGQEQAGRGHLLSIAGDPDRAGSGPARSRPVEVRGPFCRSPRGRRGRDRR
jgi:hypothetical protein